MKYLTLIALFTLFYRFNAHCQIMGETKASFPAKIGEMVRPYSDNKRLNWEGTAPRPLVTQVWYPAAYGGYKMWIKDSLQFSRSKLFYQNARLETNRKFPLILISHGAHANADQMQWLACYLASTGFIAAVVNNNGSAKEEKAIEGFTLTDFCMWERPRDLSVVLDWLLSDPLFGKVIDTARIGSAGFSLGGATAIWVAGAVFNRDSLAKGEPSPPEQIKAIIDKQIALSKTDPMVIASFKRSIASYYDPRFKAVFALAPAIGQAFPLDGLSRIKVPVQIVVGDADIIAPKTYNADHYTDGIKTAKKLIVLPGERGHYTHPPISKSRPEELNEVAEIAASFFKSTFDLH